MKKIVLTMMAVLTMNAAFAEGENVNEVNASNAYEMNISMYALSNALGLSADQVEAVESVNKTFAAEMMNASVADKSDRAGMVSKAVKKDLSYMHYILDREQYRKYLMLLNVTLKNRGLMD